MDFTEDSEFRQILDEWKPYLPKTEATIQIIVEELKRGSDINWGNFRILIGELYEHHFRDLTAYQCRNVSPNCFKFEEFILSVLTVFEIHKCPDMSVIADILEFLCFVVDVLDNSVVTDKAVQMGKSFDDNNGQGKDDFFEKLLFFPSKDIPLHFCHSCDPVWKMLTPHCNLQHFDWLGKFTSYGKVDALKAIISFGATPIVHKDARHQYEQVDLTMRLLLNPRSDFTRKEITSHVLQNLKTEFNERSRRRLFFIDTILHTFVMHPFDLPDGDIQCARIFIESSPEPLITIEEIKNCMTKLCRGINVDETVQKFLKKYENDFPESRRDSAPRSLKHLSRFQVRDNLRTARSFPVGVESLCVPKKIQDYIRFKDILV